MRARRTAELVEEAGGLCTEQSSFVVDERLREKEFGILDRLTRTGIERHHPDQAEFRRILGKFYHRPPGGESWCDVILRLRSALDTISLHHSGCRVLIVGHQVVVLCLRYLLESHDGGARSWPSTRGATSPTARSPSTASTPARAPAASWRCERYNFVAPLEEAGAPVTVRARRDGRDAVSDDERDDRHGGHARVPARPAAAAAERGRRQGPARARARGRRQPRGARRRALGRVAALRAGAGKLQIATGRSVAPHLGLAVPEALVAGLPETEAGGLDPAAADLLAARVRALRAVLVGPG